jgi:gamma-glutamylcyclotransferase (GGCT)/AIG2-like uncharacterized protein YtfP
MKLFTYGTLRQEESNSGLLDEYGTFQETCRTKDKYILFTQEYMYFPFLIPVSFWPQMAHHAIHVTGDLYEVNEEGVQRCDTMEGHPDWYQRIPILVQTSRGEEEAWVYILTEEGFRTERNCTVILPSGDWKRREE